MPKTYMLNKPAGYVTACRDGVYPTVMDCLPAELARDLHPVGRLDIDTEGLLLLTDDGLLDQALLLPENHVEKEYFFYALGILDGDKIARIEEGCTLGKTEKRVSPAKIVPVGTCTVKDIENRLPEARREKYMKNPDGPAFTARLIIKEGKHHQVKLMMRAVNCRVCSLFRVSFAGIPLDPALAPGEYRLLTEEETAVLEEKKAAFLRSHPFVPYRKN